MDVIGAAPCTPPGMSTRVQANLGKSPKEFTWVKQ